MIVATAGHIDHGKTVLVKALTGVDTDRLPEEKARGLSIDLGFAYLENPDGSVTGYVDVPGHERFVRNMLAGVSGIDYALLVVAADDGPMPQTEEHLAILDLLGVGAGAVALTKIDRVDAARREEAAEEIELLLAGTRLEGAEVFPVSGPSGEGVPALKAHLEAVAAALPGRAADGNFRLAVDRCFTLPGAGLVVTGTVFSGAVAVGDRLLLTPADREARVRSIHAQNRESETGQAGQRCALNIAGQGLSRAVVHRGDWVVAPSAHAPTRRIDGRVRVLASEDCPLRHWTPMHLHLAAADITGRVAVLHGRAIAPGESGLVQLVLDQPVGALWGDRLILRDQSARRTMAGGRVIDPAAPARGRSRPERLEALAAMEIAEPAESLAALLDCSPAGLDLAAFATSRNLTPAAAEALWRAAQLVRTGRAEAPTGFSPGGWASLRDETLAALGRWHEERPDDPGPGEDRLRRALGVRVPEEAFNAVVIELVREEKIARDASSLRLPGHRAAMTAEEQRIWEKVRPLLEEGGLRPPRVLELAAAIDLEAGAMERFLNRAARLGMVMRVAKNRFYPPDALAGLARIAEELAGEAEDGSFYAKDYRDRSGIGRNVTIQVLEYFDKAGFTRRQGEAREIVAPAKEIFGQP